jgi:hypothetical protein
MKSLKSQLKILPTFKSPSMKVQFANLVKLELIKMTLVKKVAKYVLLALFALLLQLNQNLARKDNF